MIVKANISDNHKKTQINFKDLRQSLLGISLKEATFAQRGFFASSPEIQQHLETIGQTFLEGYQGAIYHNQPESLISYLEEIKPEYRGFAYEGAALGFGLLDHLTPWKKERITKFLKNEGQNHIYMIHVGIGWLWAKLNLPIDKNLAKLDFLLGWLAIDGYGFYHGYFHGREYIKEVAVPKKLSGYACRVFDQGLGRSIWFVNGADINRIAETIKKFPVHRQADLWSGIGLACAYAGGVDQAAIFSLKKVAHPYLPLLAQGAAFAAKTRLQAGNLTNRTEIACQVLCGMSAPEAAAITDKTLIELPRNENIPAYEIWRQRIQSKMLTEE